MSSSAPSSRRVIGSLQRAFDILDLFTDRTPELGITEIANALGLHKSTASGLVYSLQERGYLEQNQETRRYRLGLKLLERASSLVGQLEIRSVAAPYLRQLSDWSKESVNLAIRDRHEVVYIERLLSSQNLGYRNDVGKRAWVHSTALGKAMLGQLPVAEARAILHSYPLEAMTPHTLTEPEGVLEDIQRAHARGFALDDEENELGGRCVAAPILSHLGKPIAAVSVSVPLIRIPRDKIDYFGLKVKEVGEHISSRLGHLTTEPGPAVQEKP